MTWNANQIFRRCTLPFQTINGVRFLLNNLWHAIITSNQINNPPLRFYELFIRVYRIGFALETKLSSRRMVKIVRVIWFIKIEKSYMICHRWTYVSGIRWWPIYTSQKNASWTCCWNCIISKLLENEKGKKYYSSEAV